MQTNLEIADVFGFLLGLGFVLKNMVTLNQWFLTRSDSLPPRKNVHRETWWLVHIGRRSNGYRLDAACSDILKASALSALPHVSSLPFYSPLLDLLFAVLAYTSVGISSSGSNDSLTDSSRFWLCLKFTLLEKERTSFPWALTKILVRTLIGQAWVMCPSLKQVWPESGMFW